MLESCKGHYWNISFLLLLFSDSLLLHFASSAPYEVSWEWFLRVLRGHPVHAQWAQRLCSSDRRCSYLCCHRFSSFHRVWEVSEGILLLPLHHWAGAPRPCSSIRECRCDSPSKRLHFFCQSSQVCSIQKFSPDNTKLWNFMLILRKSEWTLYLWLTMWMRNMSQCCLGVKVS